jgi:hypothetical protein
VYVHAHCLQRGKDRKHKTWKSFRVCLNLFTQQQHIYIYTVSLDLKIMDNIMDQIPNDTRNKLNVGGYVVRDDLPDDMRPMDRWDRVKADCGLSKRELSQLMMILCIPSEIRDKLVAGGYDLDALPNDTNMARWEYVQTDCGLTSGELCELMNILFPVGK